MEPSIIMYAHDITEAGARTPARPLNIHLMIKHRCGKFLRYFRRHGRLICGRLPEISEERAGDATAAIKNKEEKKTVEKQERNERNERNEYAYRKRVCK